MNDIVVLVSIVIYAAIFLIVRRMYENKLTKLSKKDRGRVEGLKFYFFERRILTILGVGGALLLIRLLTSVLNV